ncbi:MULTISPECIES: hypothetical protein [unclassified Chitinophaga]|uniref:hypothetical protein n=1 Tax=unclassified Chitinophaga TaxID=2619133 RepID=UPI003010348E
MKKSGFLLSVALLLAMACIMGCKKTDIHSSLQPKVDSVNNITLITYTKVKLGGSDSVTLARGRGLAAAVSYAYKNLAGGSSSIDLIFDQGKFWNTDPLTGNAFTGGKFLVTDLTPAAFDALNSKSALEAYGFKATQDAVPLSAGKVIFVHTKEGYDCLVKIITLFPPSGSVTFDYKIAVL